MSNFSPYADHGYCALIKEAAAGDPLTPTTYMGFQSESIMPSFNVKPIQSIAGDRVRHVRSVPNKVEISGDLEFYVEPKTIGHFLRALFGVPIAQTLVASESYRHVFAVSDTPKTYTIDIQHGNAPWVHRYYGVQISKLSFTQDENVLKCVASLVPRKAFINTRIKTEVTTGTTLTVGQTAGLVVGDSILVLKWEDGYTTVEEHLIAAIPTTTTITTTATIVVTIEVDDIVVIKSATPSYSQDLELVWHGGGALYAGADIDNVTAENKESFEISFENETQQVWYGGLLEADRYPGDVLTKGFSGGGNLSRFYDSESNLDRMRENAKRAMRFLFQGETALGTQAVVKASSTWGATANGFKIEATTGGKAGNDYNVTLTINDTDDLAASISGKNILVELASTTASKNTGTLIAAAVDALTGVTGTAEGTGAEQFTVAETNQNLGFRVTSAGAEAGTNVVGRDANEKPYLQFDMADIRLDSYFPNTAENNILMEEIPFTLYKDTRSGDQKKNWATRIFLVNDVTVY